MKVIHRVLCVALLAVASPALCQSWQLVWSDEFTNGISSDWVFETGTGSNGWGNNELQYYRRENATVSNGQLVITARRENFGGRQYTSARMKTQGRKSWRFGRIEARIAMPSFQGVWPAFWMLGDNISSVGWPACGEIDIMEHVNTGNTVHGTIHWQDHTNSYASYGGNTNANNITAYHIYAIEWSATAIKWFVDGAQFHEVNIANGVNGTSEFQNNFFILLNMAIGGNWPGFTIDNNAFPAAMYVDYVRVYQGTGNGGGDFTRTMQAESYSAMNGVQLENTQDAGGGQNVGWIDTGDWMAYNSINIPSSGTYRIEYRVASTNGSGRLSLDVNAGSTVLGAINIPNTGGWQNWTTISHTVSINAGTYNFGIYAQAGGWNINWWRITRVNAGAREAFPTESTAETVASDDDDALHIYPNPAASELTIVSGTHPDAKIQILNAYGNEVFSGSVSNGKIDLSQFPAGVYIIHSMNNGKKSNTRFIKK